MGGNCIISSGSWIFQLLCSLVQQTVWTKELRHINSIMPGFCRDDIIFQNNFKMRCIDWDQAVAILYR